MADVFSASERSEVMSRIRSKDTSPELRIRKGLHRLGFRFRLHDKNLPGRPDLVLPRYRTVIQVRGCFWHGHECPDGHIPKSRRDYWEPKLRANAERDERNDQRLKEMGWRVIVLWECEHKSNRDLKTQLKKISAILTENGRTAAR
jgi:DNA mismatch endonuclease, patch repair protein